MLSQTDPPEILWQPNPGPQTEFQQPRRRSSVRRRCGRRQERCNRRASAAVDRSPTLQRARASARDAAASRPARQVRSALHATRCTTQSNNRRVEISKRRARVFTHCEHEQDVHRFDGHEFHLVCFDGSRTSRRNNTLRFAHAFAAPILRSRDGHAAQRIPAAQVTNGSSRAFARGLIRRVSARSLRSAAVVSR